MAGEIPWRIQFPRLMHRYLLPIQGLWRWWVHEAIQTILQLKISKKFLFYFKCMPVHMLLVFESIFWIVLNNSYPYDLYYLLIVPIPKPLGPVVVSHCWGVSKNMGYSIKHWENVFGVYTKFLPWTMRKKQKRKSQQTCFLLLRRNWGRQKHI